MLIKIKLVGTSPLLMSNPQTVNPLNKYTKAIAEIAGKRKKSDADHEELLRRKFVGALYHDEKLGPYLPTRNVKRAIQQGATREKQGKVIESAITLIDLNAAIDYNGPRDPAMLYNEGTSPFVDVRDAGINKSRVMVCRPIFKDWSMTLTLDFDDELLNLENLKRYIAFGGKYAGIGTYRSGGYGRFEAEYLK